MNYVEGHHFAGPYARDSGGGGGKEEFRTNRPLKRKGPVRFPSNVLYIIETYRTQNAPLNLYALLLCRILSTVIMQSLHFSSFLYNLLLIVLSIYLKKVLHAWTQRYDCFLCCRKPLCSISLLK